MLKLREAHSLDEVQALAAAGQVDIAVQALKEIIRKPDASAAAIALLGKLQFVQPDQPVNDKLASLLKSEVAEVVVEIRNPCNFRCHYCVAAGQNNVPVQKLDLEAIDLAFQQVQAEVIVTAFECAGGEPTIHPQFAELVNMCTKYGAVSFPTNNSQNPRRWLPKENAGKLYIRSALHPEAEEKLDMYAENARYLIEAGAEFSCLFIAHPDRMEKIPEYQDFFGKHEIPFYPHAFIGQHDGREYPHAYTDEEKRLLNLEDTNTFWGHKIQPHTNRIRNFKGIPCLAGNKSIYITKTGRTTRCQYDRKPMTALHKTPQPCDMNSCGCGLLLEKLNTMNASFQAFWAKRAGKEATDISQAQQCIEDHGYASLDDALAVEGEAMYDELMRAYGKDEL